jgi:hypothetical protein
MSMAVVVGLHLIWRVVYYGDWLPNTYYAKVGLSGQAVMRGIKGLLAYLGTFHGALAICGLVLSAALPSRPWRLLPILFLGIWIAYVTLVLGLPAWHMAYTMPIALFALIAFGWGAADLLAGLRERGGSTSTAFIAAVGSLFLLLIGNLSSLVTPLFDPNRGVSLSLMDPPDNQVVNSFIVIGKELGRIASPEDTLAVGACGAIPYYSGLVTYDVLGLNDRHIAHTPMPDTRTNAFGHEKGDGGYILGKQPTFMIPLPLLTDGPNPKLAGIERSINDIIGMPEFRRDYEFRYIQLPDGRVVNYYRRKGK